MLAPSQSERSQHPCKRVHPQEARFMDYSQSRARPVSGSHPPNYNNSLEKRFVRKFIGALALLVGAASTLSAQSGTTISGTVTNEQGVPLPGATVLIQGTTTEM